MYVVIDQLNEAHLFFDVLFYCKLLICSLQSQFRVYC